LRAALRQQRGSDNLDGVRVAIQGAGAVGSHLARRLIEDGATVLVADVNPTLLTPLQALGAEVVEPASILSQPVDVLAPCAMGAVLNAETVQQVRASIIAGAANNQLATPAQAQQLADRGVLYVPDFVINAGGIIAVYHQRQHGGALSADAESTLLQHVEGIGDKLGLIFKRAAQQLCPPHVVAKAMAEEVLLAQGRQAATEN
jgi:leucine dehydrogenase